MVSRPIKAQAILLWKMRRKFKDFNEKYLEAKRTGSQRRNEDNDDNCVSVRVGRQLETHSFSFFPFFSLIRGQSSFYLGIGQYISDSCIIMDLFFSSLRFFIYLVDRLVVFCLPVRVCIPIYDRSSLLLHNKHSFRSCSFLSI